MWFCYGVLGTVETCSVRKLIAIHMLLIVVRSSWCGYLIFLVFGITRLLTLVKRKARNTPSSISGCQAFTVPS